jgi:signal transduction histidine kinase
MTDHPPQAQRELEREIDAELARHCVRQAPTGFVVGALTVAAVLLVLWGAAPRGLLLVWLGAMGLLTLPAVAVVWRFRRAPQLGLDVAKWRSALTVAYGLAGAGWGSASLLLFPRVELPFQLFLLFVLGGSGVGGMVALAPVRGAFVAYLTAIYVPMIGVLIAGGSLSGVATGLLLLTFWAASLVLASEFRALLVRSVTLRFDNQGLIAGLSRAKDAAEAASRAKSQFLANVSHELRTPLALILGPIRRLLGSGAGAEDVRRDLETVERNARALQKHVSDLLEVAKLEAGRLELERAPVDLGDLVRRTASLFEIAAKEREVLLTVEAPDALWLSADSNKLERVLLNLLSNALKFVPDGGRVRVDLRGADGEAVVSVADTGPGVPAALREVIFERFRRGDDDASRRFGGTGLGLAIARELVALHGGRIEVGDTAEGGALFQVKLTNPTGTPGLAAGGASPGDRLELQEVARQTVEEVRPRREPDPPRDGGSLGAVLVVEDHPDMSRFLADCLAPDYRVATARDGRHALEQALACRPDLILCDVMLPVMAGDVLVREIRAHPELEGIPIIVLTAKADDALRVRLLREGVHDFLTKPVAPEELRARVANGVMLKRTRDVLQSALSSRSRDLAALADELAASNRAKDEFLAILSHELRAPLTPILSWSILLRQQQLDAATSARALAAIERGARLQVRIVDDLLDVSRAISGKLGLDLRSIALEPVIQAAIDSARPAAQARSIALDVVLAPALPLVSGDPDRLQQVVGNLLSNAIKFTPEHGRIEVRLTRAGESLRLSVRDNGRGIRPALLPRLFESFWQADGSTTRAQGGLGLGLTVVRHLVELHGGTVQAESEGEGLGATFSVTLPIDPEPRPAAAAEAPAAEQLHGLRVLVVDDEQDICEIAGAILGRAGAEVRTCVSACQALALMDTWLPHILVSDIAMPGEDGYAFIRKVRARRTEQGGGVPAVALTAHGRSEDRARALSAGFQLHVEKPIEPGRLVGSVASAAAHTA